MVDVSISIANYNTKELLGDCVRSVKDTVKEHSFEIIVVDDASSDGSADLISNKHPEIKIIRNKENLGYVRSNNSGMRASSGSRRPQAIEFGWIHTDAMQARVPYALEFYILFPWVEPAFSKEQTIWRVSNDISK